MTTGRILIDPPVDYYRGSEADILAWRHELEAMPEAPNVQREIASIDYALQARAEGIDKIAKDWGLDL